jgi:hypothetical protein
MELVDHHENKYKHNIKGHFGNSNWSGTFGAVLDKKEMALMELLRSIIPFFKKLVSYPLFDI